MLSAAQFEDLVGETLDDLPPFFQTHMNNVVVLVETWPSRRTLREAGAPEGETLLGLYTGIPLTQRTQAYNLVPPDTITLFQGPIERAAAGWDEGWPYLERVREEVRQTVIHEIAHHFGIDDDRLEELGAY
jgi:predicted Zn-dependent protease with MMP-like domain